MFAYLVKIPASTIFQTSSRAEALRMLKAGYQVIVQLDYFQADRICGPCLEDILELEDVF